jgi:peptidoglycan/xylan/chitin deacetylase (PgdA/CDA1 family)
MYHAIGRDDEPASRYVVPARTFASQMRWLRRLGSKVVGLGEYARLRSRNTVVPRRTVVLTFDDGYADNAELAAPVLERLRFSATVFVVTGRVGDRQDWDAERHPDSDLIGRPLASWRQIEKLCMAGIEIGAHSRTHRSLVDLPDKQADDEIHGSRRDLESRLGIEVTTFSYPHGKHDDDAVARVAAAGYVAASTVEPGLNGPQTPLLRLRRAEIRGTESFARFALALFVGNPEAVIQRRRP